MLRSAEILKPLAANSSGSSRQSSHDSSRDRHLPEAWRAGRVYFLAFLNPLGGQPVSAPYREVGHPTIMTTRGSTGIVTSSLLRSVLLHSSLVPLAGRDEVWMHATEQHDTL